MYQNFILFNVLLLIFLISQKASKLSEINTFLKKKTNLNKTHEKFCFNGFIECCVFFDMYLIAAHTFVQHIFYVF